MNQANKIFDNKTILHLVKACLSFLPLVITMIFLDGNELIKAQIYIYIISMSAYAAWHFHVVLVNLLVRFSSNDKETQ
jgi:hypothetical protein